ncbi:YecA family protein [Hyalangium rubrum]|uniref:SEC-C domain-containing protein n=1 Tax=Hyalangium rubrum TaxID=3103134 RepID=A0ABU5H9S2_9BACT|nr:SEC-C domain-containing protein [Hyalangium sp. s54d21]MDY7230070.1 SEC-C domain-containing protein [Hyalangium sp. s54d21]
MSSSKPGRNDPCPCGSGKKYKVCHAAEDRARDAPPPATPHPLAKDLRAAMDLLGDPDVSKLSGALDHLGKLLSAWGPAPGLRFDSAAFETHISKALEALPDAVEQNPAQTRRDLFIGAARVFGTRDFLNSFRNALLQRASEPSRTPEERLALSVGVLLASASEKSKQFRPEDIPVLDVIFDVQFREWSTHRHELASKLDALVRAAEEEEEAKLTPAGEEALRQANEGNVEALVQHIQSDPRLFERINREAKERAARVEAKLREPATPPLFAPEEELWFTCVLWEPLGAVKRAASDAGTRRAAVENLIRAVKGALDATLLDGMLERLRQKAKDPALDDDARAWFTDLSIALEAEPSRMVMAALFTASQEAQGRSAEEMVMLADIKAKPVWTPEDFEPYRQLLETQGLPAAAERIRRSQDWLREHPVSLA